MKLVMTLIATALVAGSAVAAPDGAKLYTEKTCNACHGPKGDKPLMPNYPKIAGQNAAYAEQQMKDIKSGARNNGQTAAMKGVMHLVNDEEIKVLSEYLAKLMGKPVTFAADCANADAEVAALQPGGVLATRENFSNATVLTRGVQNKIQSMENLFAQSDLSTKFEALGLKHEVLTGVDFAWEKKIVRGARSAAQGGVTIPAKPTTTIGAGGTGWVDEDARTIGKNSEFESLAAGVYAQDLIQLAPHWKVLAGLRYDGMSAQYDAFNLATNAVTNYQQSIYKMSNRFGLLFQPSDRHSFHLSYGTSFNTSGDTYSYSTATVNTPPEKSMNVELGAKIDSADRRMSSRFALFRGVKLNERNTDPLLNIAVLSGKRHATGFETDVIGKITPRWEVYGSYTWIWDAEIDKGAEGTEGEGRRPSLIPKHQGSLWSTYQVDEKMRVGIGANARTKMTPNRNPVNLYSDGYVTYDAMAEYEAIQDKLTLKANLINLTNKFYADSMYANGHYVPGVGRTVYITGSLKF